MECGEREGGFSLIELMVAMGLTVTALGMAMVAINGLSAMRETTAMVSDENQTLRQSLNVMTRDLIVAGRLIPIGGISVPTGAGSNPIVRPSPTAAAIFFPVAMTSMPPIQAGNALGPPANGSPSNPILNPPTDMITVLTVDTNPICLTTTLQTYQLTNMAANAQSVMVDPRTTIICPDSGIAPGDLIMITVGSSTSLQMVTGVNGQTISFAPGDPMQLNQPAAAAGTLFRIGNGIGAYPSAGFASRVLMTSYFVDVATNPARPQLMRRVNLGQPAAIGIGVENLQVSYDLVPPAPNINIAQPANPAAIRKVTVFLSGRSNRMSTRSRQYLRTSLSTQVSLRNLSFQNLYATN